jgi:hypothetical protein
MQIHQPRDQYLFGQLYPCGIRVARERVSQGQDSADPFAFDDHRMVS